MSENEAKAGKVGGQGVCPRGARGCQWRGKDGKLEEDVLVRVAPISSLLLIIHTKTYMNDMNKCDAHLSKLKVLCALLLCKYLDTHWQMLPMAKLSTKLSRRRIRF